MNNLHPGLILIITGILSLVASSKLRKWFAIVGSGLAMFSVLFLDENSFLQYEFTSNITMNLLKVDALSYAFGLIFCVIGVITSIYSFGVSDKGEKCASLIYAGSSLGVIFAGDWISLICFWEVMAISSFYLVWSGQTTKAKRASYRYLVMHLFGGNMLFVGALVLCINGDFTINSLTDASGYGYWFVLIGIGVNAAIPPFHTWAPDAYPESTPSGTVYMGSFTTKVAIYALIRLFPGTEWLVVVGAVMAVFAACMALMENDLRRLLSYHIVSQLGMMVASLGTGSAVGIDGAALHAVFNILYKGVLLMGAGAVITATGKRKISQLGGLYKKMPLTAICFLIGSLSIAGMPFLNGFASKALIMEALHQGHFTVSYWLVMAAGIGTWLSITLKINYFVFFGKKDKDIQCTRVPVHMEIAMVLATGLCVITGLIPSFSYNLMPNATMVNPFAIDHVLEYIGLFIGATIPFAMFMKKMAPHDQLTLDFDWFYRKPMAAFIVGLSQMVYRIFTKFEGTYNGFAALIKFILKNPTKIFGNLSELSQEKYEEDGEGAFEGDMPVGAFMQIFVIFCIVAFIVVLIIE